MGVTHLQDRWDKVNELFHEALALPPEQVRDFCAKACGDDRDLLEFLLELIASAAEGDEALRDSISQLAEDVATQESLVGQRIGAYRIDDTIGRGGMGEVYLASRADGKFEKQVALKLVRRKLAGDEFSHLIGTEQQAMASLNHPSIPVLIDAGQLDDGRPYFICEYVDGVPVDVYCQREGLSVGERLALVGRIGEALQHAHGNLILHLDIKPDNILVQDDGRPSLLDFGVSRLMSKDDEGYRAFSPGYASPEQVRGERVSAASDVYSLGALLYHLLAGHAPFSTPRFAPSETVLNE
ncbi:MAG: serine/threonine-protein kinase, partial [Pseudomonadota bacterium]